MEHIDNNHLDILQPLADEDHLNFICNYKKKLPRFNRPLYFLLLQNKWKEFAMKSAAKWHEDISSICKYKLYKSKFGNIINCTFFAITEECHTIYLNTLEDDGIELQQCLENTNRIRWNSKPRFQCISSCEKHLLILKNVIESKNLKIEWENFNIGVWLTKEKSLALNYEIPNNIYLKSLNVNDSTLINSIWPHRFPDSENYIRSLISLNGGIGLYRKQTDELLSWIILNDVYSAGFLQTIDSEKGKGYGTLILKIFSKQFSTNENLPVIASLISTNTISKHLFLKLGFEQYDEFNWVGIQ